MENSGKIISLKRLENWVADRKRVEKQNDKKMDRIVIISSKWLWSGILHRWLCSVLVRKNAKLMPYKWPNWISILVSLNFPAFFQFCQVSIFPPFFQFDQVSIFSPFFQFDQVLIFSPFLSIFSSLNFPAFFQFWSSLNFFNIPVFSPLFWNFPPFLKGKQMSQKRTLFENYSKCRIWILAFSTNFCFIKSDLSGNTVWPQASSFQKLAKIDHFWHF